MEGNTKSNQVREADADQIRSKEDADGLASFGRGIEDENGAGFGLIFLALVVGAAVFVLGLDLLLGISFLELFA